MVPRIGAFEITVCYETGMHDSRRNEPYRAYYIDTERASGGVLLYSKLIGGMWPHFNGVADRIGRFVNAIDEHNRD